MNHDELSHLDAGYVLGALDPVERELFEEHLRSCDSCAAAVRELSGLPRLLGRVDAAVFLDDQEDAAVPDTLLPALLREVRRGRRRRRGQLLVGAAAAAGLVVAGSLAWSETRDEPSRDAAVVTPDDPAASATSAPPQSPSQSPSTSPSSGPSSGPGTGPRTVPMQQVGQQILQASLVLEEVDWGTRLELTCSYAEPKEPGLYGESPAATYTLVVQTRSGRWEQVAAWRAVPGRTVTVPAATEARPAQITAVEVRTLSGRPVLELAS